MSRSIIDHDNELLSLSATKAQEGIWLGQQKLTKQESYNTAEIIEFDQSIDVYRLSNAIIQTLNQTPSLSTKFVTTNSELHQKLYPLNLKTTNKLFEKTVTHSIIDYVPTSRDPLTNLYVFEDDDTLANWCKHWINKPLDIENNTVFSHALLRLPNGNYGWFIMIHHIACDGFSYTILTKKIQQAYNSTESTLTRLKDNEVLRDYSAMIDENRQYEESDTHAIDRDYWTSYLKNALPFSFKSQTEILNTEPTHPHRHYLTLPKEALPTLKAQSVHVDNDWIALLIAYIAEWIYEISEETNITFGCPEMNRSFGSTMRTVGLQMNILPLTVSLSSNQSTLSTTKAIQNHRAQQKAHRRFRYEQLRPLLGTKNGRAFGPIINILPFDRTLIFEDTPIKVHPLSAGPVEDIAFYFLLDGNEKLVSFIEFHPELYDTEESKAISASIEQSIMQKLLPDEAIYSTQQKRSMVDSPLENQPTIVSMFEALDFQRNTYGNNIALRFPNSNATSPEWSEITYQTFHHYISTTKSHFFSEGLRKDDLCVIALPRGLWAIVCMYSALASNANFVCVDPNGPIDRLKEILQDCQPQILISPYKNWLKERSGVTEVREICVDNIEHYIEQTPPESINSNLRLNQNIDINGIAYSIYTSGSTGKPKAVQISKRALQQFIASANTVYQFSASDNVLQFSPLHFDACIEEIFVTLSCGATLTLRSDEMLDSMVRFNDLVHTLKITVLDLPTAFWHEWSRHNAAIQKRLPTSVKTVIIGGEACRQDAVENFFKTTSNARLLNTYGPSEATVVASCLELNSVNYKNKHPASIGPPLPGRTALVVNDTFKTVPRGVKGQLVLTGNSLAEGYLGQKQLTDDKFITLPDGRRGYATGDLASINDCGEIVFWGRMDEELKISGQRIHPAEIEQAISTCISCSEVIVLPGKDGNTALYAFVAFDNSNTDGNPVATIQAFDAATLKNCLKSKLTDVQIPSHWFQLPELPKTPSGKIDKKHLFTLVSSLNNTAKNQEIDFPLAETSYTQHVIDVWKNVLRIENINRHDDFFMLGGTSLQLLQVATRLTEEIQQLYDTNETISVSDLFSYPQAEALSKIIEKRLALQFSNSSNPVEARLSPSFKRPELPVQLQQNFTVINRSTLQNVLLTGATGFVGAQILNGLLTHTQAHIYCVVRAKDIQHAKQKLQEAFSRQYLTDFSESSRLTILVGDLEKPYWSIGKDTFNHLSESIDCIIHNAASTSVVRDFQSMESINVAATITALELAHTASCPLHYVSTMAIASNENIDEAFIKPHCGLSDGYQQSKWCSEYLIEQRAKYGQPFAVYRLPRVVGDPQTGFVNPNDLVWKIAASALRLGVLPQLNIEEPWLPVNMLAGFIVQQARHNRTGIFNCLPDKFTSLNVLFNQISEQTGQPLVHTEQWLKKLANSQNSEDQALLTFFNKQTNSKIIKPNIQKTKFGPYCQYPNNQHSSFKKYIEYALKNGILTDARYTTKTEVI